MLFQTLLKKVLSFILLDENIERKLKKKTPNIEANGSDVYIPIVKTPKLEFHDSSEENDGPRLCKVKVRKTKHSDNKNESEKIFAKLQTFIKESHDMPSLEKTSNIIKANASGKMQEILMNQLFLRRKEIQETACINFTNRNLDQMVKSFLHDEAITKNSFKKTHNYKRIPRPDFNHYDYCLTNKVKQPTGMIKSATYKQLPELKKTISTPNTFTMTPKSQTNNGMTKSTSKTLTRTRSKNKLIFI